MDNQESNRRKSADKNVATTSVSSKEQFVQTDFVHLTLQNPREEIGDNYNSPGAASRQNKEDNNVDENEDLDMLKTPVVMELSNTLSNLKWGFKKR